jgi:hypothetical protein
MNRYQFTCDARVSFEVKAVSLENAVEAWDHFCEDLESDESVTIAGHHTFSVGLADLGLEISDGSGVFDREGNPLD